MQVQQARQISELAGAIEDAIIVYPGGWGDTLPDWLKNAIQAERLMNVREPGGTDAEACAYLYTAGLCFPFDSDWADIFLYISSQVYARHNEGGTFPKDIKVESLNEQQMSDLLRLKNWIHRKRVENRQSQDRAERRRQREQAAATKKRENPTLFDFANKGGVYAQKS